MQKSFGLGMKASRLLIKDVSETINNEAKEQKDGLLGTLLGKLVY